MLAGVFQNICGVVGVDVVVGFNVAVWVWFGTCVVLGVGVVVCVCMCGCVCGFRCG